MCISDRHSGSPRNLAFPLLEKSAGPVHPKFVLRLQGNLEYRLRVSPYSIDLQNKLENKITNTQQTILCITLLESYLTLFLFLRKPGGFQ